MKRVLLFFAVTTVAFGADLTGSWLVNLTGVPVTYSGFPNHLDISFSKDPTSGSYLVVWSTNSNYRAYGTSVISNRVSFWLRPNGNSKTLPSMYFTGKINTAGTKITGAVSFEKVAGKPGKFVASRGQ